RRICRDRTALGVHHFWRLGALRRTPTIGHSGGKRRSHGPRSSRPVRTRHCPRPAGQAESLCSSPNRLVSHATRFLTVATSRTLFPRAAGQDSRPRSQGFGARRSPPAQRLAFGPRVGRPFRRSPPYLKSRDCESAPAKNTHLRSCM